MSGKERKMARQAILFSIEEMKRLFDDGVVMESDDYVKYANAIKILAEAMEELK